jgi:hypothetical protein
MGATIAEPLDHIAALALTALDQVIAVVFEVVGAALKDVEAMLKDAVRCRIIPSITSSVPV